MTRVTPPTTAVADPPWAQPRITSVAAGRAFLAALRRRDTLVFPSVDGDRGYPLRRIGHRARGQQISVSPNVVAASAPPTDLVAYHRALGLGSEQTFCPRAPSARHRLSRLVLDDADLLRRLQADGLLRHALFAFKDRDAELLLERLGLTPLYCAPPASVYETANDKLCFADAAAAYGFDAVPMVMAGDDEDALVSAYRSLSARYGDGCVLRLRRGAGGSDVYHARSERAARHIWRRLRAGTEVVVAPYVPRAMVVRDVATHGIVTAEGFAPLVFTDQLVRGHRFRGGRVTDAWPADEVAAITATLERIACWLRDLGYVDAPAGIDGFLLRDQDGPRFLALDPNIRATGTMMPWAVVAVLSDAAGRHFVWQVEAFRIVGASITLPRLRRQLGADLLDPARIEQGGVLPSLIFPTLHIGALGAWRLQAILLARDPAHLDHLRAQVARLGIIVA